MSIWQTLRREVEDPHNPRRAFAEASPEVQAEEVVRLAEYMSHRKMTGAEIRQVQANAQRYADRLGEIAKARDEEATREAERVARADREGDLLDEICDVSKARANASKPPERWPTSSHDWPYPFPPDYGSFR